jgi:diguanylate cyclase (GGDEF)-like protein
VELRAQAKPHQRLIAVARRRDRFEQIRLLLVLLCMAGASLLVTFLAAGGALTRAIAVPIAGGIALLAALAALLSLRLGAGGLREVDERRRMEQAFREQEDNFRHVFDRNPQPMWLYDADTFEILAVNDAAVAAYGYSRDEFLRMPGDSLDVEESGGRQHQLKDGRIIDVDVETSAVRFDGRDAVLLLARDVTEQRVLQRRLEHNALHDPLTGLPNQLLLRNRIRRALARVELDPQRPSAMLVFDLDNFKAVNDTLGHALGDRVLAIVGARLVRCIKSRDTAARLGGDEFGVLLEEIGGADEALNVACRLVEEIRAPITLNGQTVSLNASAGVASSRVDDRQPEDLLGDAYIALSVAKKRSAGTCVVFDPAFRTALLDRITLQKELATAVSDGQLTVLYQPQLDVESGRVVAVEALVRWMHPTRGTIPPDTFIPVAEQSGLITAVDTWVLRTACKTLRGWFDDGLPPMRVAVNLSGRDLERDDLVDTVKQTLHDNMLEPWRLELELTETVAMDQADIATARLQELRTLGVRIAIDDFGTGFSMFSRLRELPVDRLKIDRSFVSDLGRDDDARTIVGSTIAMGHALGLDLVAEGVEDVETAEVLRTLQCDGAQGFYFARPLTAAQLSAWVRSRSDQLAVAAAPSH